MRKALGCTILSAALVWGLAPAAGAAVHADDSASTTTVTATSTDSAYAAASLRPRLVVGSRGPAVVYVQTKLGVAPATGYYGTLTKAAVRSLQKSVGHKVTGKVTKRTWKVLLAQDTTATAEAAAAAEPRAAAELTPKLVRGSRGPAVIYVQQTLGVTPASGYYGTLTEAAVRALQSAKSLKVTGQVTKGTWKVLLAAKGVITLPVEEDTSAAEQPSTEPEPEPSTEPSAELTPEQAAATKPTLSYGMGPGNPAVIYVQQYLHVSPTSGYFGTLTKAAVTNYQKALGISATGTVGPLTWAAILAGRTAADVTPTPSASPSPTPTSSIATPTYELPANPKARQVALAYALEQVGKKYVLGGNGPDVFDCSGLVQQAYLKAGVRLPRLASQQRFAGTEVTLDQLLPGDLLYYQDGSSPRNGHIAMYAGKQLVVEASNPKYGVRMRALNEPWYRDRFVAAVRIG